MKQKNFNFVIIRILYCTFDNFVTFTLGLLRRRLIILITNGQISEILSLILGSSTISIVGRRVEPLSYGHPPLFMFFPNPPLLTTLFSLYHSNKIRDKHENKLM